MPYQFFHGDIEIQFCNRQSRQTNNKASYVDLAQVDLAMNKSIDVEVADLL